MNIVTSLLNLKKNMSNSPEVKDALEDCRNRVFSMALVHQNVYNNDNVVELNFKDYISMLTTEIKNSLYDDKDVDIELASDDVCLDLSTAIPCGLILNELITNSFKYAKPNSERLKINVTLKLLDTWVELVIRDNGKGLSQEKSNNNQSLGMELIKSLSEQINGTHSFKNDNGLVFKLKFNMNQ